MATIIIRNLDDEVAERLRLQARLRGVSVEEEARAGAIRARQRPHRSSGVDSIREDRAR